MNIRFTAFQIELVKRADPASQLHNLTELTFEFDKGGNVIDCLGRCEGLQLTDDDYDGPGLLRFFEMARKQCAARLSDSGAKVLSFQARSDDADRQPRGYARRTAREEVD
jgi:hypothetical protein